MKILFLNHNTIGYGTYWRCINLGKYLARLGHKVTVVTVSSLDFDLSIKTQELEKGLKIIILPRIKISQYHTGHTIRAFLNTIISLFSDYDVLHSYVFPSHPIAIPTFLTKLIRKKPLVLDGDDLWRGGWANYHSFLVKAQLEFCEDKLSFMADAITVVSDKMKKRFLDLGIKKEKIFYIPNGASIKEIVPMDKGKARKKIGLEEKRPYVLVMGHTYTEGLYVFLESFNLIVKKKPSLKLLFLGKMILSGSDKKRFDEEIKKIGKNNCLIAGEKSFNLVPYYLAACDILALPMDDNAIEEARFPMRFGDYLCAGRPIVSNAVGEVKYYLEKYHCGLSSPPKDAQKMAQNMEDILGNKMLSDKLSINARDTAVNVLSWSIIVKNLEKVYLSLLTKKV